MGIGESKLSQNEQIVRCIQETAEAHGISTTDVLDAVKDLGSVRKVYGLGGLMERNRFFTTPVMREIFADAIDAKLIVIKGDSQCLDNDVGPKAHAIAEWIRTPKKLGQGSFGTVYKACAPPKDPKNRSLQECDDKSIEFAVKVAQGNKTSVSTPRKDWFKAEAWHESYLTRVIQDKVLGEGKGQAVPRIYREFACLDGCTIDDKSGKSCSISLMELGDGTLNDWAESDLAKTPESWNNALFQLMAGLAALQSPDLQIYHNDIKAVNILYYRVQPGGYWEYKIGWETYNIPNLGFILIIADYGVSQALSPDIKLVKHNNDALGERGFIRDAKKGVCYMVSAGPITDYAAGINRKSLGITRFYDDEIPDKTLTSLVKGATGVGGMDPLRNYSRSHTSKGPKFVSYGTVNYQNMTRIKQAVQKDEYKNIEVVFYPPEAENYLEAETGLVARDAILSAALLNRPSIYPPLQFGADVQDVIRTFTGGKRMEQPGMHPKLPNVPQDFRDRLYENYLSAEVSYDVQRTSSFYNHKMFAQDFIHHYFKGEYGTKAKLGSKLAKFECYL